MKNYKLNLLVGAAALLGSSAAHATFSSPTGYVTPDELTITFTKFELIKTDGSRVTLASGTFANTFKRADKDLAQTSLSDVTVPYGRYAGLSYSFQTAWKVKLSGARYYGSTTGGLTDASSTLTTVLADGRADNAVATSGTAVTAANVIAPGTSSGQTELTGTSYFENPACVADDATGCTAGDQFVGGPSAPPPIVLLMDLYHSITVDASAKSIAQSFTSPIAIIGSPGVAIHLATNSSPTYAHASLVYTTDKKLLWASMHNVGYSLRAGSPFISNVTAAPAGKTFSTVYGNYIFSWAPTTGNGTLQFPVGDATGNRGLVTLTGIIQAAGSAVTFACAADPTGSLGWTYTGASSCSMGAGNFRVARIVDPANVFGVCTSASGTFVTGSVGTCRDTTLTTTDGYPL